MHGAAEFCAIAREIAAGLAGGARSGRGSSRPQAREHDDRARPRDHHGLRDRAIDFSRSTAPRPARRRALQLTPAVEDDLTRVAATVVGEVIGTIEYMAPEQARGEHVDQRADVYAFGLIVYDMLVGKRRSEHAVSAVGELQKRLAQPPPPVRTLVPAVPEALDALVTKCVEPDPAKRYQTTAELVAALDRLDDNGKLKPKKRVGRDAARGGSDRRAARHCRVGIYWIHAAAPSQHDPVSVVIADFVNKTERSGFRPHARADAQAGARRGGLHHGVRSQRDQAHARRVTTRAPR